MLNVLNKNSIGLDISDYNIEIAELERKGSTAKVMSLGRIKLSAGIVELGRIKDEEKLLIAVKKAFISAKPIPITGKKVIFGSLFTENLVWGSNFIRTAKLQPIFNEFRAINRQIVKTPKITYPQVFASVTPAGFEPAIFGMKTRYPRPLDDGVNS